MKKVLSVALASAMVLGLGANAFALEYNSGSNDKANWPTNFEFKGSLFVTDKDDKLVTTSSTALGSKEAADFRPGDVIWMPLYADNQKVYQVNGNLADLPEVASKTYRIGATNREDVEGKVTIVNDYGDIGIEMFNYRDTDNKVVYWFGDSSYGDDIKGWAKENGWRESRIPSVVVKDSSGKVTVWDEVIEETVASSESPIYGEVAIKYDSTANQYQYSDGTALADTTLIPSVAISNIFFKDNSRGFDELTITKKLSQADAIRLLGGGQPTTAQNVTIEIGTAKKVTSNLKSGVVVEFVTDKVPGQTGSDGKINDGSAEDKVNDLTSTIANGPYTGNIDKNWSINLLEKTKGAEEVIDSAEFYRADAADVAMYGSNVVPNAVYVKVTLKDYFDSVNDATLKYYVYVADNNGNTKSKTNEVWVEGKYENDNEKYVNFDWSNNANSPAVWKVRKGENGTAVFDFEDKVFFTVKMYSEEKMYLDLSTAYDKIVAGDFSDADFDSFFKFQGTNANFSREGQLLLASDDEDLFVYEIDADGNLIPVDAEYVKDYKIAHTNTKANGYLFNTKELGNYVLSATELEADDEELPEEPADDGDDTDVPEEPTAPVEDEKKPEPSKPNPNTGANDFVGVAVALAVVSVAAAGALALKK